MLFVVSRYSITVHILEVSHLALWWVHLYLYLCRLGFVNKVFVWDADPVLQVAGNGNDFKVLFGVNDISGQSEVIIVEGELDKLALEEAGFTNAVSVPDGAPSVSGTAPHFRRCRIANSPYQTMHASWIVKLRKKALALLQIPILDLRKGTDSATASSLLGQI